MTEQKQHPHAEFLRALADGESIDGWECRHKTWTSFDFFGAQSPRIGAVHNDPDNWQVRRKRKMIRIGTVDVPEPMRVAPPVGAEYWLASSATAEAVNQIWQDYALDVRRLKQGVCHLTKEAAEAHRRALILVSGGTP